MSSSYEDGAAEATKNAATPKANDKASTPPLVFESRFETGNLQRAVRVYDREYDLHLGEPFFLPVLMDHLSDRFFLILSQLSWRAAEWRTGGLAFFSPPRSA